MSDLVTYPIYACRLAWMCLVCLVLALPENVPAQNLFDPLKAPNTELRDVLPGKPSDYLADEAKLFTEDLRESFRAKSTELAKRQNVHLYVVTSVYIHGESAQKRARRIADLWLRPQGHYGAVILYDQGTRGKDAIGLACAEDGTGVLVQEDLYRLLTNAHKAAAGAVGTSSNRVEAAYKSLEMGFRELKPRLEHGRWLSPRQMLLIGLVLGSMLLTLLLLWWVKRVETRNDEKNRASFLFPEVTILPRFGASRGGGVMAQTTFSRPAGNP